MVRVLDDLERDPARVGDEVEDELPLPSRRDAVVLRHEQEDGRLDVLQGVVGHEPARRGAIKTSALTRGSFVTATLCPGPVQGCPPARASAV